jgi:hypothetical protein
LVIVAPPRADEALTEPLSALPYLSQRELTRRVDIATSGRGQYLLAAGDHEPDALLRLSADITHVGRGCGAALHLDDRSVSRRHAILVRRSGVMWVLDDRSANGVFVNGRRTTQASLHDGDELLIGRLSFTYVEH